MKIATIAAVVALFAAASASASPVNLITNGDFEAVAPGSTFSSGFQVVNNGSSAITGWTVGATSVDLIRNAYNAINGYSIDMLGTPGPGFLSQSFNVVAGQTYNLAFDMARNPGGPAGQGVAVNFGGVTQNFYSTAAASNTLYSNTLSFTAASTGRHAVRQLLGRRHRQRFRDGRRAGTGNLRHAAGRPGSDGLPAPPQGRQIRAYPRRGCRHLPGQARSPALFQLKTACCVAQAVFAFQGSCA